MTKQSGDCRLQRIEIRLCIFKFLLGASQFCGRYHIHGTRNLHGILDTFHPLLNFLRVCHVLSPAFKFFDCCYNFFGQLFVEHFVVVQLIHDVLMLRMEEIQKTKLEILCLFVLNIQEQTVVGRHYGCFNAYRMRNK